MAKQMYGTKQPMLREEQADETSRLPSKSPELSYIMNNVPVLHETLLFVYQGMFPLSCVNLVITRGNLKTILYPWKTDIQEINPSPFVFKKQLTAKNYFPPYGLNTTCNLWLLVTYDKAKA